MNNKIINVIRSFKHYQLTTYKPETPESQILSSTLINREETVK